MLHYRKHLFLNRTRKNLNFSASLVLAKLYLRLNSTFEKSPPFHLYRIPLFLNNIDKKRRSLERILVYALSKYASRIIVNRGTTQQSKTLRWT